MFAHEDIRYSATFVENAKHHYTLQEGGYHYDPIDQYVIVKGGAADMPAKRWDKLFLNACRTGDYYCNQFNQGTVFYSWRLAEDPRSTTAFFKGIIDGRTDEQIYETLRAIEPAVFDYWQFSRGG